MTKKYIINTDDREYKDTDAKAYKELLKQMEEQKVQVLTYDFYSLDGHQGRLFSSPFYFNHELVAELFSGDSKPSILPSLKLAEIKNLWFVIRNLATFSCMGLYCNGTKKPHEKLYYQMWLAVNNENRLETYSSSTLSNVPGKKFISSTELSKAMRKLACSFNEEQLQEIKLSVSDKSFIKQGITREVKEQKTISDLESLFKQYQNQAIWEHQRYPTFQKFRSYLPSSINAQKYSTFKSDIIEALQEKALCFLQQGNASSNTFIQVVTRLKQEDNIFAAKHTQNGVNSKYSEKLDALLAKYEAKPAENMELASLNIS